MFAPGLSRQVAAAPPMYAINSRRLMSFPKPKDDTLTSARLLTQPNPAQNRHESWKAQYPAGGRQPPAPSHGQTGCKSKGTSRGKPESAEEEDPGPRLRGRVRRIKCHWREDRPRQDEEGARGAESK